MTVPPCLVSDARRGPFGLALKGFREARKVSQSRLAERANVDHSYISRLESGARNPTRGAVDLIAQALELELDQRNALMLAAGFSSPSGHLTISPVARDLDVALIALRTLDLDRAVALEAIVLRLIDLIDVSQNRSSAA